MSEDRHINDKRVEDLEHDESQIMAGTLSDSNKKIPNFRSGGGWLMKWHRE